MKICSTCDKLKSDNEFYKHILHKDGLTSDCKECSKTKATKRRINFPWNDLLADIKQRCENPLNQAYKWYGFLGIKCLITSKEIKQLMIRDNYYNLKNPTIDRINNDGDYELNNCQFIEKSENSKKDKFKPIIQFDLNGKFIKEWDSAIDVEKILSISRGNICSCCNNNRKSAGKFKWSYKQC